MNIYDMDMEELTALCRERSLPAFRAKQIWRWLYVQGASDWSEMTNLSEATRAELGKELPLACPVPERVEGTEGGTQKILVRLHDNELIEEVIIPASNRRTVCISSQVGCRYHCAFCASGQSGFIRNLSTGEMVCQVILDSRAMGDHPTHVVFMGIGEPFDNYDAVLKAIRIINDGDGLKIGARRITVSTSGIIPGIRKLAGEGLQVELSVSLHGANDQLRSQLMPVNKLYPVTDLVDACADYFDETNRLITFEYTLIKDVNDGKQDAKELAHLLSRLSCRVNLIPLSPVEEYEGQPSSMSAAHMFMSMLKRNGINCTLRNSKGSSLRAACGQLRSRSSQLTSPDV